MLFRTLLGLTMVLSLAPSVVWAGDEDHLSELGDLRAVHAWARATDGSEALVYVEIENKGDNPVSLEGGATGIAETVELVGFQLKEGEATYQVIPSVPVAPGRDLHLEPNGLALRLVGLRAALAEGEEFDLDIQTSIGVLEVHVEIEASNATSHSHAGHNH